MGFVLTKFSRSINSFLACRGLFGPVARFSGRAICVLLGILRHLSVMIEALKARW